MAKAPLDVNERAHDVVARATGQRRRTTPEKNPEAVERGRRGGQVRASRMTPQERSEDARKAVEARWAARKTRRAAAG